MSSDAPAAPPKKSKKKLIIAIVLVLVLGAAGAGAWYFMSLRSAAALAQLEAEGDSAHPPEPKTHDKSKKPIFLNLENFTVNLNDPGGMRLAQIGITLRVDDPEIELAVKDQLPVVRNKILLLISGKKIEDLLTLDGKKALARQVQIATAQSIGIDISDDSAAEPAPATLPEADEHSAAPAEKSATPAGNKAAKSLKKKPAINPIKEVLFSTFIVQ